MVAQLTISRRSPALVKNMNQVLVLVIAIVLLATDPSAAGMTDPAPKQATSGETPDQADLLILENSDYFAAILARIREAKTNINLTMFVFKTGRSTANRPGMIAAELISAARRGVRVRVFLEHSGYDEKLNLTNRQTAKLLQDNKIEVIFDSANVTTHSKLVVVDDRYSFVGSHNFTHAALKYNNELSILIDDRKLARKLNAYMETIITGNQPGGKTAPRLNSIGPQ